MTQAQKRNLLLQDSESFLAYLEAVSKVSQSAILDVEGSGISSLVSSPDCTLILHSIYSGDINLETTLNVPNVSKMLNVLKTVGSDSIDFDVYSNHIIYKGGSVKFKYHLFEDGFLVKPNLSVEKINNLEHDIEFVLTKNVLQQIFRGSTFASETNKAYFYTDNGKLVVELTDRARHNTDSFTITVCDCKDHLEPTPISIDNIRLLTCVSTQFDVKINTQYGALIFEDYSDKIRLKYVISSLTQ